MLFRRISMDYPPSQDTLNATEKEIKSPYVHLVRQLRTVFQKYPNRHIATQTKPLNSDTSISYDVSVEACSDISSCSKSGNESSLDSNWLDVDGGQLCIHRISSSDEEDVVKSGISDKIGKEYSGNTNEKGHSKLESKDDIKEIPKRVDYRKFDEKFKSKERKRNIKGKSLITIDQDALKFVIKKNPDDDEDSDYDENENKNLREFSMNYVLESVISQFQSSIKNHDSSFEKSKKKCLVIKLKLEDGYSNVSALSTSRKKLNDWSAYYGNIILSVIVFFIVGLYILKKVYIENNSNNSEDRNDQTPTKLLEDILSLFYNASKNDIRTGLENFFQMTSNKNRSYNNNHPPVLNGSGDDNLNDVETKVVTIISQEIYSIFYRNIQRKLKEFQNAFKNGLKNPIKFFQVFIVTLTYLLVEMVKFGLDVISKTLQLTAVITLALIYLIVNLSNWIIYNINENVSNLSIFIINLLSFPIRLFRRGFSIFYRKIRYFIYSKESDDWTEQEDIELMELRRANSFNLLNQNNNADLSLTTDNSSFCCTCSSQSSFTSLNELTEVDDRNSIKELEEDEESECRTAINNLSVNLNYLDEKIYQNPYENLVRKDFKLFQSRSIRIMKGLTNPHLILRDLINFYIKYDNCSIKKK
ncbi:unnamed protein product [Dimorphilus gyrociliatus]|uniref:Uncharacterized protein n=1 Tax=Dimorphilus gyrociliatus TaxID=2664684 RepID=A0A7I8VSX1_9ANNE|nr:unnamed protein product [Dimorphilus gyrociliatus]